MTNTPDPNPYAPAERMERLAESLAKHVRISHAMHRGDDRRAADLLRTRIEGVIGDTLDCDHDECGEHDENLIWAAKTIDESPGPLGREIMQGYADREIERLRHA